MAPEQTAPTPILFMWSPSMVKHVIKTPSKFRSDCGSGCVCIVTLVKGVIKTQAMLVLENMELDTFDYDMMRTKALTTA